MWLLACWKTQFLVVMKSKVNGYVQKSAGLGLQLGSATLGDIHHLSL